MTTGYLHPLYAETLSEFGTPRELPQCGGWILEREIPGFPYRDAMGCYPLFSCRDWSQLAPDLEDIGTNLISLALVTDPLGEYNEDDLNRCFHQVTPFKEHFIADLCRPMSDIVTHHHRYHARHALKKLVVEEVNNPIEHLEDWLDLYGVLTQKHHIQGIRAFSRAAFTQLFNTPGLVMVKALCEGVTVGAQLIIMQGDVGYAHLAAFSETGYKLGASYALDWSTLNLLSSKIRWLDWGGGAGVTSDGSDGLSQYKRGWSTDKRMAYFCGRIFNQDKYHEISTAKNISSTDYFPAYRKGEFS